MFPLQGGNPVSAPLYSDDVFSAYTYTGNGATQTITNGIDLAGKGGMVWTKSRTDGAWPHVIAGTNFSNISYSLSTNNTTAIAGNSDVTSWNSNGYTMAVNSGYMNYSGPFVSWTFRKAPKFFDVVTYTGNGVNGRAISHALGQTPGLIIVKCTSAGATNWGVWHRSLNAGTGNGYMWLNLTNAQSTFGGALWGTGGVNYVAPTGTTFTVSDDGAVNTNGATYVAYLFAHDTGTDGLIQCGSFTTDGSGKIPQTTLGWEPQYIMFKGSSAATNWVVYDTSRGLNGTATGPMYDLKPNSSSADNDYAVMQINATGFLSTGGFNASTTYIYLAIRRPNKPPTLGTQVYNAIARTGTGAAATVTGVGFAPDLLINDSRSGTTGAWFEDRLRGATKDLTSATTAAETTVAQAVTAFNMDGASIGTNTNWNTNAATYINWFFKRAPGVFDEVCYTGTGANTTQAHSLGVAPELWIVKGRSGATAWHSGSTSLAATEVLVLNTTAAKATDATSWNSTYPTSTVFSLGTQANVNTSAATYVAYLFATKAGISKVFSYTGNGSSQTINCGFTTGARWVMIKRTDSTGDWFVWDSTRGIIAANDPHLSLNTTAAEVTTDDSVDTDTTGFIVNQVAATNVNVTSATYIGLALS